MWWRRWITISALVVIAGLVIFLSIKMPATYAYTLARDLLIVAALFLTFYFGGASAGDIALIVGNLKLNLAGRQDRSPYDYSSPYQDTPAWQAGAFATTPDAPVPADHPLADTPFGGAK